LGERQLFHAIIDDFNVIVLAWGSQVPSPYWERCW